MVGSDYQNCVSTTGITTATVAMVTGKHVCLMTSMDLPAICSCAARLTSVPVLGGVICSNKTEASQGLTHPWSHAKPAYE